jgi:protein subunit release factor A
MATHGSAQPVTSQREELASIRPRQAKADLTPQGTASSFREIAAEAIHRSHGKQETAAHDVGIHFASLSRQLKDGTLRLEQMEKLGPAFAVTFAEELLRQYGELANPKDYALRKIDEIESALREIRQYVRDAA